MEKNQVKIFCDGGARGNPGPAAWAFVVYAGDAKIWEDSGFIGKTTNNVAEYQAVIHALKWLVFNKNKFEGPIFFYLDSELVVNQLNGRYKIKSGNLKPLIIKVRDLENQSSLTFRYGHVLRNKNKIADALLNQTLDTSGT